MSWHPGVSDSNIAPELQTQNNELDFGNDLGMFSNEQFFDLDLGFDGSLESQQQTFNGDGGNVKVENAFGFADSNVPFSNFSNFPYPQQNFANNDISSPSNTNQNDIPIDPLLAPSKSRNQNLPVVNTTNTKPRSNSSGGNKTTPPGPSTINNDENVPQDEAARLAAEEDKRRRNTAASARFRIKKKQREQATERKASELGSKVEALEARVRDLEKENDLLKGLLTEKERRDGVSSR